MIMAASKKKIKNQKNIVFAGNDRNTVEDNFPITFQFLPLPLLKPKKLFINQVKSNNLLPKISRSQIIKGNFNAVRKKISSIKQKPKETQSPN
jgi:hypothetical protein